MTMKIKGIYNSLTVGICVCFSFMQNSFGKGIRTKEEYESSAGYSSELSNWQVALIVISMMVTIPLTVILALYLYDKLRKKTIEPKQAEDVEKRDDMMDVNVFRRRPLPAIKTKKPAHSSKKSHKKESVTTMSPVTQFQRPLGTLFHMRQGEVRPLPPISTSVFIVQRPPTPPTYESLFPGNAPY